MKKILTGLVLSLLSISSAFACWFTQENFNNSYIAGVNYYFPHYDGKSVELNNATFTNNQSVSLPLTVWCKVGPRTLTVNDEVQVFNIRVVRLYYKILPGNTNDTNAKWRLAKEIDMGVNPKWNLNFASPVKLFGDNIITKKMIERNGDTISKGDGIIIAFYFSDDSANAISNAEEITTGSSVPLVFPSSSDVVISGGGLHSSYSVSGGAGSEYPNTSDYKPPYIMRVIFNGKNIVTKR